MNDQRYDLSKFVYENNLKIYNIFIDVKLNKLIPMQVIRTFCHFKYLLRNENNNNNNALTLIQ